MSVRRLRALPVAERFPSGRASPRFCPPAIATGYGIATPAFGRSVAKSLGLDTLPARMSLYYAELNSSATSVC